MKRLGTLDFLARLAACGAAYTAVVLLGTGTFMLAANVVGYVPYSDRPGPGWYGFLPVRSLRDLAGLFGFFMSWVLMSAPTFSACALLVALPFVALGKTRAPLWLIAVLAAPVLAFLAAYMVAALGWMIAIAMPPVIAAASFGAVFAVTTLPAIVDSRVPWPRA